MKRAMTYELARSEDGGEEVISHDSPSLDEAVPADRAEEELPLPDGPPDEQPKEQPAVDFSVGAGRADTPEGPRSFQRLLMELAAEHQRELSRLRTEYQQREAESRRRFSIPTNDSLPYISEDAQAIMDARGRRGSQSSHLNFMGSNSLGLKPNGLWTVPESVQGPKPRISVFDYQSELSESRMSQREPGDCQDEEAWAKVEGLPSIKTARARSLTPASASRMFHRFIKTQAFDCVSCAAIILNSILLGWAANYSINATIDGGTPDTMPRVFKVLTISFTLWFTMELGVRMYVQGIRKFFCGDEVTWNLFDSLVVGSDFVHSLLELSSVNLEGGIGIQNLTVVRMLRVLRITRAVRVVRLVRFFRELRMMVYSVLRSGSSLFWSLLLLSVTIYIFGVYFIQIVAYHLHSSMAAADGSPEPRNQVLLKEMFGNLLRAEYTLYQAVSGGISWGEIGSLLIQIDVMHGFVLCFFTFFTTFALMNIITGIFVDSAIHSAQNDKDEVIQEQLHSTTAALQEMKKIFQTADRDGSGAISLEEFEEHLSKKEVRAHLSSLGIETDRAKGLFRLLDLDMSGQITIEEFVYGCMRLKGAAKSIDLATLMYENKRMAEQWRRFFTWSEAQFRRLHRSEARIDERLAGLLGEDICPAPLGEASRTSPRNVSGASSAPVATTLAA